jgi:hypothetical protein
MANTPPVPRTLLLVTLLALLTPACGKDIGDSCSTNVDCAQNGTRDCDLSQPGGYCTVNGCDEKSCPSGSVCIRIFPYNYSGATCSADANCPSDHLCLPEGLCVPRASERRYCEKKCGGNGDCRDEYVCREAGIEGKRSELSTYGSIALVAEPNQSPVVKFCAPKE